MAAAAGGAQGAAAPGTAADVALRAWRLDEERWGWLAWAGLAAELIDVMLVLNAKQRKRLAACRPGRSVFDLSVSAGPGDSEQAGGREKTKTGKQGPGGGAGAPRVLRPPASLTQVCSCD